MDINELLLHIKSNDRYLIINHLVNEILIIKNRELKFRYSIDKQTIDDIYNKIVDDCIDIGVWINEEISMHELTIYVFDVLEEHSIKL